MLKIPPDMRHQTSHTNWACRCYNSKCPLFRVRVKRRKRPDMYKIEKYGQCKGCGRMLSVDWTRMRVRLKMWGREKDQGKVCNCVGRVLEHTYGQKGCLYRDDFILETSLSPKKHDPKFNQIKPDDDCPF